MPTIRASRDQTLIPTQSIMDKRLSFTARGLYHCILSYAGTPEADSFDAFSSSTDSRQEIATALDELEEKGYLQRSLKENGEMDYLLLI
jgi:hypothetical protein